MKNQIYHIRKPFKKQRVNQYYKDYSNRGNGTFCGAIETSFDTRHSEKAVDWANKAGIAFKACKACKELKMVTDFNKGRMGNGKVYS